MNNTENAYCRLCAELKSGDKLINLQSNEQNRQEIVEKLTRISTRYQNWFSEEDLPKTVCFVCINALERSYDFILGIEQAQTILSDLIVVQQIKKESILSDKNSDSDFENIVYEAQEDDRLVENIVVKLEAANDHKSLPTKIKCNTKKKFKSKSESRSLDAIPLSQLKLTWKDYSWLCSFCGTQFANIEELKNHTMQYHDSCHAYRCTDCNIRKLRLDSFLLHVKRHRKYLKLSCYLCNERFSTTRQANQHKSEHMNSKYICYGCNGNFHSVDELNNHMNVYNKDRRTKLEIPILQRLMDSLTCLLCKKTFKTKGTLTTHLLTHTDRKRDHTCDKCGKCFYNKQNLLGHMILHDEIRPFQCEICKMTFKTYAMLRNHLGVHGGQKPFRCNECGRCFRLKKQLKNHSIIHTDALPYICSYCNKGFRFKTILNQHIRQHTGVKPYNCPQCQRDFTNWPNYNKHMKRRHGMDMAKKKHTPDGVYPINPTTGEIIVCTPPENIEEWKQKMLAHRKPGRPKMNEMETEFKQEFQTPTHIDGLGQ